MSAAISNTAAATSTALTNPPNRLEQTTVCLPLVYGSIAFYLGKEADEFQTHQWTLFLRGPNNEDLSLVISKVVFQLHASFAEPTREQTSPPFELTEKGWGEFEAQIRVYWKDPLEQHVMFSHVIKLYPPGIPANTIPTDTETPVVAEAYDEVVFTDPTESFFAQLQRLSTAPSIDYSQQAHFTTFSDTEDVHALLEAQKFLQTELVTAKERLGLLDKEMVNVEEALRLVQERRTTTRAKAPAAATSPKSASKKAKIK